MAEAVVSAVVDQLISAGADWLKEEISLLKDVESKRVNMVYKMQTIQSVLADAENQSVERELVKRWLKKLEDVSYDLDDVLDEWTTTVHMLQRDEAEQNNTSSPSPTAMKKLNCCSLKILNSFSSVKQLPWRPEIASRFKKINQRIDLVFSEMKVFEFASKAAGNDAMNKITTGFFGTTTPIVDESKVFGRGDDKKFLLGKVLSQNTEQEKTPQVISIVGSGGLGKTTLAQMVYKHGEVKEKFGENRIWVCISDPFDEFKVARDILEGLKVGHSKMISLENLQQSLGESLSGRKFFLVLDDVWNESPDKWERLRICLKLGDPESRILVTTRKNDVALILGTTRSNILTPRFISDLDCWKLMNQIAFQGRTGKVNDELEAIGKEIAKKCRGLPLAAKTLGGVLRSEVSVAKWTATLNSEIWKLEQAIGVEIFPHIFLSYQELPAILKRCFSILAIFPKDTRLKVEDVIGIWMAHGFLNQRTKQDDVVNRGQEYLEFLISHTLLEETEDNGILMHNIIHDFALYLLWGEVFSINFLDKIESDSGLESTANRGLYLKSTTARHLYIDGKYRDHATSIGFDVKKLRTCIMRNVAPNITLDLVKGLKMVRALYLARCGLKEVPEIIEKLIHLRLLDLSDNLLVKLPETIGCLYNMQQLNVERSYLLTLPDSIEKLSNLIFLRPDGALEKFPESVGKLINLQYLGRVPVKAGKSKLGFLKDLNQLRGKLEIAFRSKYNDEVDVKKAAIEDKKHITDFALHFNDYMVTDGVIAALQPPSNIQVLEIYNLERTSLPGWITSLSHLTDLGVDGAPNCSTLPLLGELQYLTTLRLSDINALKSIGREFLGIDDHNNNEVFNAFPSLLELYIVRCHSLEEWSDIKAEDEGKLTLMPKLQRVEIRGCRSLKELPSRLLCRASLEELRCEDINSSLGEYIKNDKQLLRTVKKVFVERQQCSLPPLAD